MIMKTEVVEQLIGMLSESLSMERATAQDRDLLNNRVLHLKQDLAARDHELKELRDARAQERAEPEVAEQYDALLAKVHAVMDDVGIDEGPAPERLDRMVGVVRQLCHDKSMLRDEAEAEVATLKHRVKELTEDRKDWRTRAQEAIAKVADLETHARLLKEQADEKHRLVVQRDDDLAAQDNEIDGLRGQVTRLQRKVEELEGRNARLPDSHHYGDLGGPDRPDPIVGAGR